MKIKLAMLLLICFVNGYDVFAPFDYSECGVVSDVVPTKKADSLWNAGAYRYGDLFLRSDIDTIDTLVAKTIRSSKVVTSDTFIMADTITAMKKSGSFFYVERKDGSKFWLKSDSIWGGSAGKDFDTIRIIRKTTGNDTLIATADGDTINLRSTAPYVNLRLTDTLGAIIMGWKNNFTQNSQSIVIGSADTITDIYARGASIFGGFRNKITSSILYHAKYSTIVGGSFNFLQQNENSIICGGMNDTIFSGHCSGIFAGRYNYLNYDRAVVIGGEYNRIIFGWNAVIVGGNKNYLGAHNSAIIGGVENRNEKERSVILGGYRCFMSGQGHCAIIGGELDTISGGSHSVVVGGTRNLIGDGGNSSFIGSGEYNRNYAYSSATLGGTNNNLGLYANFSSIIAGRYNTISNVTGIWSDELNSVIIGGKNNTITGRLRNNVILAGSNSIIRGGTMDSCNVAIGCGAYVDSCVGSVSINAQLKQTDSTLAVRKQAWIMSETDTTMIEADKINITRIRLKPRTSDPTGLQNGDIWYKDAINDDTLYIYINGVKKAIVVATP